jgi:hypothetical protein
VLSYPGTEVDKAAGETLLAIASAGGDHPLEEIAIRDSAGEPRYRLMDFSGCAQ